MGVSNVSNSKSDLQCYSRALAIVPFDRPHTQGPRAEAFKIWGGKLRPEGPKSEAQRAESGGEVLGEGAASPLLTS